MTRELIIFILTITSFKVLGQTKTKCNCGALVDTEYKGDILVFDKPNGNQIKKLKNNIKGENYLIMTIDNDSLDFLHVNIGFALTEGSYIKGWVKKSKAIGTYARNYGSGETFTLSVGVPTNRNYEI